VGAYLSPKFSFGKIANTLNSKKARIVGGVRRSEAESEEVSLVVRRGCGCLKVVPAVFVWQKRYVGFISFWVFCGRFLKENDFSTPIPFLLYITPC